MKILEFKNIFQKDFPELIKKIKAKLLCPAAIILSGPVGAGKTTFTKYFVEENRMTEVLSPTYSLINEAGEVAHADFYRIEKKEELIHLEIELYCEDKKYFLIEWGKPFENELKRYLEDFTFYELVFESGDSLDSRNISLHYSGE